MSTMIAVLMASASAEVREQLRYRYYPVSIASGESLRSALNRATPIQVADERFHGHADWRVDWHYQWRELPSGRCRVEHIEVTLNGTIQLPRLLGGGIEQRQRFDDYLTALQRHELGHYGFGQRAAREIDWGLKAMVEAPDCQQLEASIQEIGHRVLRYYQEQDDRYDRDTNHGQTQGVVLEFE